MVRASPTVMVAVTVGAVLADGSFTAVVAVRMLGRAVDLGAVRRAVVLVRIALGEGWRSKQERQS
jgi:hypothetical protein